MKDRLRNALIQSVVVTFSLSKRLFEMAQLLSWSNPGPLQSWTLGGNTNPANDTLDFVYYP